MSMVQSVVPLSQNQREYRSGDTRARNSPEAIPIQVPTKDHKYNALKRAWRLTLW